VYPPIVARQRLGRNVTAVKNTHATIEELLDVFFNMARVVSRKVGDQFFPELLVFFFYREKKYEKNLVRRLIKVFLLSLNSWR
jgi:hypothetical protein